MGKDSYPAELVDKLIEDIAKHLSFSVDNLAAVKALRDYQDSYSYEEAIRYPDFTRFASLDPGEADITFFCFGGNLYWQITGGFMALSYDSNYVKNLRLTLYDPPTPS